MLKMPVDENKIESRLRSLSESIALMHIDFAGFFEEYSLKESIDSKYQLKSKHVFITKTL